MRVKLRSVWFVVFIIGMVVLTGCNQQAASGTTPEAIEAPTYTGVLRADYENALDVQSQLALGTLRLEGTADALTAAQAAQALPLWKTLQDDRSMPLVEEHALAKQIEGTLTEAQLTAIAAMQLTSDDAQSWLQAQGPGMGMVEPGQGAATMPGTGGPVPGSGGAPGAGPGPGMAMSDEDRAAMREKFENMTEEERAQMQAQFGQDGGRPPGGGDAPAGGFDGAIPGVSMMLRRAVVTLLTERSGQAAVTEPQPVTEQTAVAEPTATVMPVATMTPTPEADTPVTIITLAPWKTPEPEVTATPTATQAATTNASVSTPIRSSASASEDVAQTETVTQEQPATQTQGALVQKTDTDPGPPLTVEMTTNTAESNPLLEGSLIYRVAGFVHNPTAETYQVTAVHVTFFDADGFRGAFYAFPRTGGRGRPGGEWIAHGATEAQISCTVLGPGESCPFVAEIAGQDMASFLVHPDAQVAEWHESVGVTLSDSKIAGTGTNYVRVSGVATNPNSYALKNVVISALLLDDSGQTLSMGTGVIPALEAGASANFEVYVEKKAYTSYQLHARAEQAVD